MASETSISNRALQLLGAKRITALTENSNNGRSCNACYEPLRDALLEKYRWTFSIKRAVLAADSTTPDWGRNNAFTLPSDYIKRADPYNEDIYPGQDWEIEGNKIYSNEAGPLYLRYVARVTDVSTYSPLFCEALAHEMAMAMCEEITQSNTKKGTVEAALKKVMAEARISNSLEKMPMESPDGSWITERD
jgi:hypothetical protein